MRPVIKGAREERFAPLEDVEVREDEGKAPVISGLAIRYGTWSENHYGFVERFMPGCFTKTLQESPDLRSFFNHDPNMVIGRTKAGTLTVEDTTRGLRYEATPPDTTWANDLIVSMRRKDIDGSSFMFRAIKDEWEEPRKAGDPYKRTVLEAQLFELGPVTLPFYGSSNAQVRSALVDAGIDLEALGALFGRHQRGITLLTSDVELVTSSIEVLRSLLPAEPAPPLPADDHSAAPVGRSVEHLRRRLALAEAAV